MKKYCTTKNGFYFGRKHLYIAEYNEFNKRIIRNYDKIRSCMFYDLCKRHEVETTDKWYMDFLVDNELYVKIVFFIDIYELGYLSGLIRENQVAKSTYKGYYDHVNGRMIPYFESEELLLKDITLADIYNYIEYLFTEELKPNTVKHHRSILSCIFTRAVEQELFEYNFINNLKPIKSDHYIGNFYKHEELLHLFEIIKNTTIRLEVIIAAVYGLRREEVLGLKWDAIDFNRKTITIKHTVQRFKINGKTQFVFKDKTKSQSSYRTLPLFDFIEILLKEYKAMYVEYKKIFGNTYCNKYKDYVCLMPNGELMKPGYLSHTFSKLLEDNELKRIRLHDLRHSCATLLVQNKVPIKDIQIWLGHSNIQTTMIYTHIDETNKEVSAQVLVAKFQYILTNYKENEIYEMGNQTLNNIYEDMESLKEIEKVVATVQV